VRIGELARRADATVKTIRHYESLGLITAARRTNGYRDFDEQAVRFVREIRLLGRLGIPAVRTRPFLDCLAQGGGQADDCASSLAGYREAIDDLTTRIESLVQRRSALQHRLRAAAYCWPTSSATSSQRHTGAPANWPPPEFCSPARHRHWGPSVRCPGYGSRYSPGTCTHSRC
jgi:DNA-binding transcriptional MerR regulator